MIVEFNWDNDYDNTFYKNIDTFNEEGRKTNTIIATEWFCEAVYGGHWRTNMVWKWLYEHPEEPQVAPLWIEELTPLPPWIPFPPGYPDYVAPDEDEEDPPVDPPVDPDPEPLVQSDN